MILQELVKYYDRLASQTGGFGTPSVAEEGFQTKPIPFVIVLDSNGEFVDLEDTRTGEGRRKQAREFTLPREVKRAGPGAWQRANILWDNPAYVLGQPPSTDAERKHRTFLDAHDAAFSGLEDSGIGATTNFLTRGRYEGVLAHPLWPEVLEAKGNVSFRLAGEPMLVAERPAVKRSIAQRAAKTASGVVQACLITGDVDSPPRLHAAIKGVIGANSSGANVVSFNLQAFGSYGKEQSLNAPVGKKAEFAYTTALNTLLRDRRHRLRIGDATAVFWTAGASRAESVFAELFGSASSPGEVSDGTVQTLKQMAALYCAPLTGVPPEDDPEMGFFVLGLAPNAARIAIRFWYSGTVRDVVEHMNEHFEDIGIIRPPKQPEHLSLFRLLVGVAQQGKAENIPPNLPGEFMKSILAGTPYPRTVLQSAVVRCRAEREVTYPRAALVKAVLARHSRHRSSPEKEVGMALDLSNTNVGYRLGRLFAVLEKIQEEASPGINATIRDRFYGAASSAPVAAYPHLMKLKNHHLAKLERPGRAVKLERIVGEIVDGIDAFPAHLRLEDQGRFAVGYYHQRQDFFKKADTPKSE